MSRLRKVKNWREVTYSNYDEKSMGELERETGRSGVSESVNRVLLCTRALVYSECTCATATVLCVGELQYEYITLILI